MLVQHEFDDLKSALTNEPILAAPEFSRTFILATDASARAIGGVLSQPQPNGSVLPIAYYSKKLNETQARYTATEKETYAAMKGIQHYSIYLMGQHFILETDHKPLLQLRQMNNSNQKLMRWSLQLQTYDFEVKYRPGKDLGHADGLSRPAADDEEQNYPP